MSDTDVITAEAQRWARYQSSVTIGRITITRDINDLSRAEAMQARYRAEHKGNRNAFGRIYDRKTFANVEGSAWRGGSPIKKLVSSPAEIFAKLARRAAEGKGAPVSVITEEGVATVGPKGSARTVKVAA
ncbi:hypothetical protein JMG10_13295 [Nostoc ellipsosporum NOK]|nr:hypothetical protein [Nostoc ellipsosporum NOK]